MLREDSHVEHDPCRTWIARCLRTVRGDIAGERPPSAFAQHVRPAKRVVHCYPRPNEALRLPEKGFFYAFFRASWLTYPAPLIHTNDLCSEIKVPIMYTCHKLRTFVPTVIVMVVPRIAEANQRYTQPNYVTVTQRFSLTVDVMLSLGLILHELPNRNIG
ncbi:hypothetical protein PHSY_002892 [Pseudozyma hubeiensis SY62]|uniref:Uncharacterized protein n=1 Tax=Pseudozyma hubeiensis (strain SY62) TaxID=1305764 RepID=R9P2A8_PSEHS|nr:hypothetical protein PHSY_002892 [Pseudozyma hubeiensis SY62]GAC95317.1 hypothetical protein PHSY_002892 [Pseudozyma hubeiensis SY62]